MEVGQCMITYPMNEMPQPSYCLMLDIFKLQALVRSCSYMPFDSYMQPNGLYELHHVDHPFEGIGEYTSAGSMIPSATFNDLGQTKRTVTNQVGSYLPLLTPKTEVSHLMECGFGSYKAYEMNGRFATRSRKASSNSLKKAGIVKGQWTPEEDRKLVKLVEQFGLRKWSCIAQILPGRVGKQCRERWHNHLRPNIKPIQRTDTQGMFITNQNNCGETQYSIDELLAPICDEFSVENMCDGLFDANEDVFQVCGIDDDVDMNCIFNQLDYAGKQADSGIDMEMTWDDDAFVDCDGLESAGSSAHEMVQVKEEMDLVEMMAATTQNRAGSEDE
ncbi:hypothetical protein PR202_ga14831 [Eleusine coracana subsp. coracana]|uniref:Uncharacterized protein n=1 Tax=Eleusine coracana subsp. coracana TaxID=191504 RepID=A0AAV5CHH7_ELECO|nr:hypothetical protein PR202_ga14831 [Eleusine coracana subsp. coracana]